MWLFDQLGNCWCIWWLASSTWMLTTNLFWELWPRHQVPYWTIGIEVLLCCKTCISIPTGFQKAQKVPYSCAQLEKKWPKNYLLQYSSVVIRMNRISILLAVCCSQLVHGGSTFHPTFTFQVTRGEFNDAVRVRHNRQMKGEKFCKRLNGIYSSHTCICVHPTPLLTSTKSGNLDWGMCSNFWKHIDPRNLFEGCIYFLFEYVNIARFVKMKVQKT